MSKKPRKSTMVDLPVELAALNTDGRYGTLIAEAMAGEFHDYKNDKYVCGKVELVNQLTKFPELSHIREAVINGEYDEVADEEDKENLRAFCPRELWGTLGLE